MTLAEAVAVLARPVPRAPVVSTRHFASRRGSSRGGRLLAPAIASRLAREIAISEFVAGHIERRPEAVLPNAVPSSPLLWKSSNRTVLVLQRLEPEKDTITALHAWRDSRLVDDGWQLRVVGEGTQRAALEAESAAEGIEGVTFAGWQSDVAGELARAGALLASAPAEPFGLAVVEAMAAGVPVVACSGGGHLETAGLLANSALFPPRDVAAAAAALRTLASESTRTAASSEGRRLAAGRFAIGGHVDQLLDEYAGAQR
jgi:glycosyltransferase involved in cell wall biosynthesis